jgi:hypothetical protein
MDTIYEPVVPIHSLNIEKVSIKDSVFVYDDPVYSLFTLRIIMEEADLKCSQLYQTPKIYSHLLQNVQQNLEKKIEEYRKEQGIELENRKEFFPNIPINITSKSVIDFIPTKLSCKPQIQIRTKEDFPKQLLSYYGNKFGDINAKCYIILKPVILKKVNLVWFEIEYAEVRHSLNHQSACIYKNLRSCDKVIKHDTINI